jgi:UDP-N-acetylmuramoyl-L-alanyl-D-glutamate--2,6-diaminopimelate ligase
MNALAASGAASQLGLSLEQIGHGLSQVNGVIGRWQVVQDKPFLVVVDFGHTPQALRQVLPLARQHVDAGSQLIHVFGCAGGRDSSKRRVMGELSGQLADMSVVTMEDPRLELLDTIQASIIKGLQSAGKKESTGWKRIDDRQQAIAWAIGQAKSGDVVLLTGKGHEASMSIGGIEVPWNEVAEVEKILGK